MAQNPDRRALKISAKAVVFSGLQNPPCCSAVAARFLQQHPADENMSIVSTVRYQDHDMEKHGGQKSRHLREGVLQFLRKCLYSVLAFGPMPDHIAFIMDGNRRFANHRGLKQGTGHNIGFSSLVSILQYCYEMGVKYVTVYAFSIDNFKRKPDEVRSVMNLMEEKIGELLREESVVSKYGIRINFWGNLNLLDESVRLAVEKAMTTTAMNTGPVLSVCVAYTSTNEIVNSVQESFAEKMSIVRGCQGNGYYCNDSIKITDTTDTEDMISASDLDRYKITDTEGEISLSDLDCHKITDTEDVISASDLDRHLYSKDCPDPDIVVRTSGETRLSNFLLWQSTYSHLQNPVALWPEFSFRHLVWAILEYQKVYPYLKKRRSSTCLF